MAKGFASAREAFAEIEARKNSGGGGGLFFKLPNDGDSAVVRFAVEEPSWAWVHSLPRDGKSYRKEVCRDQDPETGSHNGEACPGCDKEQESGNQLGWTKREYRRSMEGIVPLIWRDAPVYEEDENGKKNFAKVVGNADQLTKWTVGRNILEELDGKAVTYKGIMNRDFKITRRGAAGSTDTTYDIEPVLDDEGSTKPTPLSEEDQKMIDEGPDFADYYKIPAYEDWGKKKERKQEDVPAMSEVSAFQRRRN